MKDTMESVILVDENDREIGSAEKLAVHQNGGRLHRAFSVFILNSTGQMLLQQRAPVKYHFGNLWTNACCGHPRYGEQIISAARRRVGEELGIKVILRSAGTFIYRAEDRQTGLVEHEFDHLFVGIYEGPLSPNPDEIAALKWLEPSAIFAWLDREPEAFTPWFPIALQNLPDLGDGNG